MIRGNTKFDGLSVFEGNFSFLGAGITLEAKAAFVNTKSGDTHGWTTNKQWSPAVLEKLKELRALLEVDLGTLHMTGGGETLVTSVPAAVSPAGGGNVGGLGEHLGGDQV